MKLNILLIALFLGLAFFLLGCFIYFLVGALPAKHVSRIIPVFIVNLACAVLLMLLRRLRDTQPVVFKSASILIDVILVGSWAYLLLSYVSQ